MTFTHPFVTSRFVVHAGDSYLSQLSLSVLVIDAFTGKQVNAPLRVFLKQLRRLRPLRSQSGFFCFEGNKCFEDGKCFEQIKAGKYTLVVEPDPTTADWFYLQPLPSGEWTDKFEREITLPMPDPQKPLVTVTFSPKASYPFPANATLVRGRVIAGANGPGIPGAVVKSTYHQVDPKDNDRTVSVNVETQTDSAGEYVLFFQKLPGKTQPITVTATKDGKQGKRDVNIMEGTTLAADPLQLT
ncbi:MAG TPA: carboxypeptidase-like regulatory domain-containing protein [Pyrinomonadaceae bacterium]